MNCKIELSVAYPGDAFCTTHHCHPDNCPKKPNLNILEKKSSYPFGDRPRSKKDNLEIWCAKTKSYLTAEERWWFQTPYQWDSQGQVITRFQIFGAPRITYRMEKPTRRLRHS